MSQPTVRPMTEADLESFWRCFDAVARERRYLGHTRAIPLERLREGMALMASGDALRVVAVEGGEVVGWCDLWRRTWEGQRHAAGLGMGLLGPYRGRGLGRALLDATLAAGRAAGITRVELEVYDTNLAAIRLYERAGFQREGLKRRARILDGRVEDIVCMAVLMEEPHADAPGGDGPAGER